jgi:hypothetical protein
VLGGGFLVAAGVGALGGMLGILIMNLVDSRKSRGQTPEYLSDPEIQAIASSVQKPLSSSMLLAKMPLAGLTAEYARLGFVFQTEGRPALSYSGVVHKKNLLSFLHQRHVTVSDA